MINRKLKFEIITDIYKKPWDMHNDIKLQIQTTTT